MKAIVTKYADGHRRFFIVDNDGVKWGIGAWKPIANEKDDGVEGATLIPWRAEGIFWRQTIRKKARRV